MRFEKFKRIAEENLRCKAFKHGEFSHSKTFGAAIIYLREDGSESKVYYYEGNYGDILLRIIPNSTSVTKLKRLELELEDAMIEDGTEDPFLGDIIDNSERIEALRAEFDVEKRKQILDF